jgi:hypothetical protein
LESFEDEICLAKRISMPISGPDSSKSSNNGINSADSADVAVSVNIKS